MLDPFRTASYALLLVPLSERKEAFDRVIEQYGLKTVPPAVAPAEVVDRLNEVRAIAAEIGLTLPPTQH